MDIKSCRVLVTATSFGNNDPTLKAYLESQVGEVTYNRTGKPLNSLQLAELLPGIDGLIAGLDTINAEALKSADRLQVISRYGVGVDNVDLEYTRIRNIVVTNTPGANSVSVAELTLGLILALLRQIPQAVEATRRGEWPRFNGFSLEGRTVGIIGFGSIGKQVGQRLKGFSCKILAYDPFPDLSFASEFGIQICNLDELLNQSDIISLHLPSSTYTQGLVDEGFLNRTKPGAMLINTSRGDVVDEVALYNALQKGQLAGAALDVFRQQPPDPFNPLLALPNVLVTPHMGAHSDGATNAMGWMSLRDCLAVLRSEEPKFRVPLFFGGKND
jgi:D-3-phosphoglycerate dehydrogenase